MSINSPCGYGLRLAVCLSFPISVMGRAMLPALRAYWEDKQRWSHMPGIQDPGILLARSVTQFPSCRDACWVEQENTCPDVADVSFGPGGGKPTIAGVRRAAFTPLS